MPPLAFPSSELSGGSFEGTLDMHDGKVTYANGIWKKGNMAKYFSGGFEIVEESEVVTGLRINGQRIPNDQIPEYDKPVQAIIRELQVQNARIKEKYHSGSTYRTDQYDAGATSDGNSLTDTGRLSYSATTQLGTVTADKVSILGTTNTERVVVVNKNSSTPNSAIDPIINDIIRDNLATDKKDLSFKLDRKNFVVNGLTQPREIADRFRQKYVQGKKDAYFYMQKDNSITSSVTIDR